MADEGSTRTMKRLAIGAGCGVGSLVLLLVLLMGGVMWWSALGDDDVDYPPPPLGGGEISVVVEPPGTAAEVLVDGVARGMAPLTVQDIPAGEHEVQVVVEGVAPHVETVEVMEGELALVEVDVGAGGDTTPANPQDGADPNVVILEE